MKLYLAVGAGGFAIVILGLSYYKLVTNMTCHITPALEKLEAAVSEIEIENSASKEVVRNNTDAIKEVSKSNDNIAAALSLLRNSLDTVVKVLDRHDQRAEKIDENIGKIRGELGVIKQTLEVKR